MNFCSPSIAIICFPRKGQLWILVVSVACFLRLVNSFSVDTCYWNEFRLNRASEVCRQSSFSTDNESWNEPPERPPIPSMPSDLFQEMARSQLELLANSLTQPGGNPSATKVDSMALYLPQENVKTGQLEFTPVVLYPDPNTERVFIASDAGSGQAPTLPKTLTKLPGFSHATSLLPAYPMLSSDEVKPGVGVVEEVLCDVRFKNKAAALSVPLLSGSQTVGVLLVSPAATATKGEWTKLDREQVSRAAQSLSMALSMDNERKFLREQNNAFRDGLSDSLHQVKNPLQALRTYGKMLQRQIADTNESAKTTPLRELVERLMVQSERVVDLMVPMDSLLHALEDNNSPLALMPATKFTTGAESLVKWKDKPRFLPWENETIEFARRNGTDSEPEPPQAYDFSTPMPVSSADMVPRKSQAAQEAEKASVPIHTTVVGDSETEMIFIADVLDSIFSAYEAIATERGIRFEIMEDSNELPGVMAAPRSVQEAVSNVLDNAFKYVCLPKAGSPFNKNPSPRVRVRLLANDDPAGVRILVEDNGPGIRRDERDSIFRRGYRSEGTNSAEGTGLGLDISRTLMHRLSGTLSVADPEECSDCLDGAVLRFQLFRTPA
jgi:signal transduction histidine kinase